MTIFYRMTQTGQCPADGKILTMDYGLVVDVETTGLSAQSDSIIEMGLLLFAVTESGAPAIQTLYGGVEDPGRPLSPEIVTLTGLTDETLAGQQIDWGMVNSLFSKASIIIAHNAAFDRSFIVRHPKFEVPDAHWACSVQHIDWHAKGFKTRALNYLAADHGFVNPFAHRALFDCATTFRLIADHLPELIAKSYQKRFLVQAFDAPFDSKDALKQRNYRWNAKDRVWQKPVLADDLSAEREFLGQNVYGGMATHSETELTWDDL